MDRYRQTGDRYLEADTLSHLGQVLHTVGDRTGARRAWTDAQAVRTTLTRADREQVSRAAQG